MNHPFALSIEDLAHLEEVTPSEAEVTGALKPIFITLAINEGGIGITKGLHEDGITRAWHEIGATTLALGEEGGHPITTKAYGEEGGDHPITQSCQETGCDPVAF